MDLAKLEEWAKAWGMHFNPSKCHSLSITHPSSTVLVYFYSLCGEILSSVTESPYLGVLISEDLSFSKQVSATVAKANRTLGFLSRSLRQCPPRLNELAYASLCRSTLEYASQVWDPPENSAEAVNLERTQRRAARFVKNDYRKLSSVTGLLRELYWSPLAQRRKHLRLNLLYQILHDEVSVQFDDGLIRRGRRNKLLQIRTNYSKLKNSFIPRTVTDWNSLNQQARDSTSLESFRQCLPQALY